MSNESNEITVDNCNSLIAVFMEEEDVQAKQISKSIGCSVPTVLRILAKETLPTEEFMKQIGLMFTIGFKSYSKLSSSDKESISESIGSLGGGALGFAGITAAISASGTTLGLSAAGITSGLTAIGFGGMVGGVMTLAAVPIAAGGIGYGIIKGVKYLISEKHLKSDDIDEKWETKVIQLAHL